MLPESERTGLMHADDMVMPQLHLGPVPATSLPGRQVSMTAAHNSSSCVPFQQCDGGELKCVPV